MSHTISNGQQYSMEEFEQRLESEFNCVEVSAGCATACDELRRYLPFPKLYEERLRAQNYPSFQPKVSFMDLPGEIRNSIYRHALVKPSALQRARRYIHGGLTRDQWEEEQSMPGYFPSLRLLRANKKINQEASDIFYGENEFRFISNRGWLFTLTFLSLIGTANVACIRRLTTLMPCLNFQDSIADYWACDALEYIGVTRVLPSLPNPRDAENRLRETVKISIQMIHDIGQLDTLRSVMQDSFTPAPPGFWSSDSLFEDSTGKGQLPTILKHMAATTEIALVYQTSPMSTHDQLKRGICFYYEQEAEPEDTKLTDSPRTIAENLGWKYIRVAPSRPFHSGNLEWTDLLSFASNAVEERTGIWVGR